MELIINFAFGIYEANKIGYCLYPTANTVGYIHYTLTEHFEGKNISSLKDKTIASEKLNNCSPMRLALGKMINKRAGFIRSQTNMEYFEREKTDAKRG